MDDLVKRLRIHAEGKRDEIAPIDQRVMAQAADRIEAAEARVRELGALVSEAREVIAELLGYIEGEGMPGDYSAERALLARMRG